MRTLTMIFYSIVILGIHLNAQTLTTYTYDVKGNRIKKEVRGSSPHPTVTASPEAVNPNQPSTLTATGCPGTVQWSPAGGQGNQVTVTPTAPTEYAATCVVNGCTNNGFAKVKVNIIQCPVVDIGITASKSNVFYGQQITLNANGCNVIDNGVNIGQVQWSNGALGQSINTLVYGASSTYTATCSTPYCPNLSTKNITITATVACNPNSFMTNRTLRVSKQSGNWNDPNTWHCGVPHECSTGAYIENGHVITVNTVTLYKGIISGGGYIRFEGQGQLSIPDPSKPIYCY